MYRVYFILNRTNGKAYAGVTQQTIRSRFRKHRHEAKSGRSNRPFHRALRKYGEQAFDIINIWEGESREQAFKMEEDTILGMDLMNSAKGYNLSKGGESGSHGRRPGFHVTEATKQKLRLANLGKKATQETRDKMSKSRKGVGRPDISERNKGNQYALGKHWTWGSE